MLHSGTSGPVVPLRLEPLLATAAEFEWEHISYLLPGAVPTVIDPGPAASGQALVAAVAAAGLGPSQVQQVLLTSQAREVAAAAERFPNARIFAAKLDTDDQLLRRHRAVAFALGDEVVAATLPSATALDGWQRWRALHAPAPLALPNLRTLADGAVLLAGDLTLVASHRAAFSDSGAVFAALDGSVLFAGEFGVLEEDLPVGDWQAFAEGLGAVTQGVLPDRLYPSRGRIEATGQVAFRAMALSANNLISNLPLALSRPATLQQIFERDLGYWPDAIAESALRLARLRAALEELARAGVVHRQLGPSMLATTYAMVPV